MCLLSLLLAACDEGASTAPVATTPSAATPPSGASSIAGSTRPPAATAAGTPSPAAEAAALRALDLSGVPQDGYFLGKPDAKVTLTMYEDFQCPFCLQWTLGNEVSVIKEYVLTGKVRLEFRNLPILGDESVGAAFGAQCAAAAGHFWDYHRALFLIEADAGQLKTEQIDAGRFTRSSLGQVAADIGMDPATFDACLDDPAMRQVVVDQVRGAQQLQLNSTPSFLVNGTPLTGAPRDLAGWRQLLDDALAKAQ